MFKVISILFGLLATLSVMAEPCKINQEANFIPGINASIYLPKSPSIRTVVFLPPTVGKTPLDSLVARRICNRGIRVILMNSWNMKDLNFNKLNYIEDLLAIGESFVNQALWRFPPAPNKKIGIVGVSLGGFIADHLRQSNNQIGPTLLIAVGEDIDLILSKTKARPFRKVRAMQMDQYDLASADDYQRALLASFKTLGSTSVNPAEKEDILMVIPTDDKTVSSENQIKLWESWGRPDSISIPLGHIESIALGEFLYSDTFADFFNRKENL